MAEKRLIEKLMAAAALAVAAALAFTSLLISEDHDITANVLFVIAQFLVFAASILGIDYHFDGKVKSFIHERRKETEGGVVA